MIRFDIVRQHKWKFVVLGICMIGILAVPLLAHSTIYKNYILRTAQSFVPVETDTTFKKYISLVKDGEYENAYALLPFAATSSFPTTQEEQGLTGYLAGANLDGLRVIGAHIGAIYSGTTATTQYDIVYETTNNDPQNRYTVIEVVAVHSDSGLALEGVHVSKMKTSLVDPPFDTVSFILMCIIQSFIIYTAYRYLTRARSPGWILFLVILLLTLSFRYAGDEMTITIRIPAGCIYYWVMRKKYELVSEDAHDLK